MKEARHEAIADIVRSGSVRTQEELRERLADRGVTVTQATLSRDIRQIGLVKSGDRYRLPEKGSGDIPQLLKDSVISIDHAVNTVVFKCHAGMAMAACATFDRLGYEGVVGTLAGDDTIFILMRSEKAAAQFEKQLREVILTGQNGF